MTDHRARPDQWVQVEEFTQLDCYSDSCILELRARIAKLERGLKDEADCNRACNSNLIDRIKKLETNSSARLTGSNYPEKPDSSLVERVAVAMDSASWQDNGEARAAIREVAEWLRDQSPVMHRSGPHWAEVLEQEAER